MLALLPTPIEPAPRLARALDMDEDALWVKRDDLTGLGGGGNKARKLVHLGADAVAKGCDVLVTGGGRQSNHCRMTAAAANRLGMACTLVLSSDPVATPTGNVLLDMLFGASVVWAGPLGYAALDAAIAATAAELAATGHKPYAVPIGGASTVGELGYVDGAAELRSQMPDAELVVVAVGSGGTHAGLAAGYGDHGFVLGVDVGARPDAVEYVARAAAEVAIVAGLAAPTGAVQLDGGQVGPGYAEPTEEAREALELAARCEGLILEPVYTAKAMAGLVAARRAGRIDRSTRTVFVHTGGMPVLWSPRYTDWLLSSLPYGPG